MRIGLVHFMAFPATIKGEGPVVETIRKIAIDDYFSAIEITTIKDPEQRMAVKKMLETSHMTIAYGAQPRLLTTGLNINHLVEEERQKALQNLMAGIDEAYEIGATSFAFLSGNYEESRKEEAFQALVNSTNEICRYKRSLIGPADLALRYAKEIRKSHDHFGLMVDLSHIPLIHETIEESLLPVKDYIVHAHIGNCVMKDPEMAAYGDVHPRFGFPNGENDVDEVVDYLRVLLDIGFLNTQTPPVVSFEIKPFGDEDADIVIANAKRVLNLAWARV